MTQDYVFSVSEYIDLLNETLKVRKISLQGEITSFNARGGAVFFTIADPEEEALLECIIWKSVYENLGIDITEGEHVKLVGTASVYKKNGRFRFIAYNIVPLGEGALKKAFEKLKVRLEQKGYFKKERKREIPRFVKNIALITANKSDAKKDFETHVGKHGFNIYYHDVNVEGANAIKSIVKAFNTINSAPIDIDVIVLTRGGGSMESLMAFNSEDVAKAIFGSRIPVISGVGHENDVTIADLVADLRVSTPTHAGKAISQPFLDLEIFLNNRINIMKQAFRNRVREMNAELNQKNEKMFSTFGSKLENLKNTLEKNQKAQAFALKSVLQKFEELKNNFIYNLRTYKNALRSKTEQLKFFEEILSANDPKHKLKQGYSITTNENGKIVRDPSTIKADEIIITKLYLGDVKSKTI